MDQPVKGLGGWLFLLYLNVGILYPVYALLHAASALLTLGGMVTPGTPTQAFALLAGAFLFALGVTTNVCMLRHKPLAVKLCFATLIVWPVWIAADGLIGHNLAAHLEYLIRTVSTSILWCVYLLESVRVRNTFYPQLAPAEAPMIIW